MTDSKFEEVLSSAKQPDNGHHVDFRGHSTYRENCPSCRGFDKFKAAILAAHEAAKASAIREARIDELKNCLEACQTRHPMESIDYLEARLRSLPTTGGEE